MKLLGPDMVSKEDLAELKEYGKLPSIGDEVDLIGRSFSLGRLSAISKKDVYSEIELEQLSKFDKFKNSTADKLAIREVKLRAAGRIQAAISNAIETASEGVSRATTDLFASATVRDTLLDEVTLAVREKKTRQQLASSLGNKLKADLTKDIKKIAITEMHRAKQRGIAMAIANKVDIYKESDGVDSEVSVVPNSGACKDCRNLYLDDNGNPRVFKLKDLVARGSNADPGVSHTVGADGLRTGWKAVMPPAHPHCFCELTYMPPGMKWRQGKLVSDIQKAVDTGSLKPTIKPPGPKSTQGPKIPKPGNVPGLAAKPSLGGSSVEPQPPASDASNMAPKSPDAEEPVPCRFGGGPDCRKHGGSGFPSHRRDGKSMREHAKHMGSSADAPDQPEDLMAIQLKNDDYRVSDHSDSVTLGHLSTSDIAFSKPLGDSSVGGINDSVQAFTKDNGSGILKSSFLGDGLSSRHEAGSYSVFSMSGSKRCYPTVTRTVKNTDGREDLKSFQAWNHQATSAGKLYEKLEGVHPEKSTSPLDITKYMLEKSTNKEQLIDHLTDIIIMDVVLSNSDRHHNNIMVTDDFSEAYAIDHGFCYGVGLDSYKNVFHEAFNSLNMKTRIPPEKKEWLNKVSFGDFKRATEGSGVEEWRAAQSFLRAKFVLDVEDKYGHVDYKKVSDNSLFENFVLEYIDSNSNNPESPDYATAKYFSDIGVLMDPDQNKWGRYPATSSRAKGRQYEYEMYTRSHKYITSGEATLEDKERYYNRTKELRGDVASWLSKDMQAVDTKIKELREKLFSLQDEYEERGKKEGGVSVAGYFLADEDTPAVLTMYDLKKQIDYLGREIEDRKRKYEDLVIEEKRLFRQTARKALTEIVPPGQEEIFDNLRDKFQQAMSGVIPEKSRKPDYSKLRPKRSSGNTAADIEAGKRLKLGTGKDKAVRNFEDFLLSGERLHPVKRQSLRDRGFITSFGKLTDAGKVHAGEMIRFYRQTDPKRAIRYVHGLARNNGLRGLSDSEALKHAKLIVSNAEKRLKKEGQNE